MEPDPTPVPVPVPVHNLNFRPASGPEALLKPTPIIPIPPQQPVVPVIPKILQKEGTYRLLKSSSTCLNCAVCFSINARACKGCHNIAYCSREHQISHWDIHRENCRPIVHVSREEVIRNLSLPVEERRFDPYTGMYRAARDLRENETVLELQPVMHVPHNKGLPIPPDSVLCLGCNRWYQLSQGYRCTKCKWPVCCEKCEVDSCHSRFECKVFVENKVYPPMNPAMYNGDHILALRCLLLKEVKPEDWEQLVALEPVVEKVMRPQHCLEADEVTTRFLLYTCNLKETLGMTIQGVMSILKVIDFCSIWLPERSAFMWDKQFSFVSAKYVFPTKVLIAEECNPNTSWSLRHSPDLSQSSIRIKASTPIPEGQYLSACFTGLSEYGASFSRRYENCRFLFKCKCRRCVDPTEGGSFFSGVKCSACEDHDTGYLLPEDPSEYTGTWRCYNPECGNTEPGIIITEEVDQIHQEIMDNSSSLVGLLNVIKSNEESKLHKNHYLLMKASQLAIDLCWGVCQNSALHVIGTSLLEKAKTLTEKLAAIYKNIYHWYSIQNAKLLFHYQMVHGISRIRELLWLFQQNKLPIDDKLLWPNEFWDILKIQKAAVEVLMDEPFGSVERENAILMKGVMEDTEAILVMERYNYRIQYETVMNLQKIYSRYCSGFLYTILPVFEDKELNELVLFTGPFCRDLLNRTHCIA